MSFDEKNIKEHNKKKLYTCFGNVEESYLPLVKEKSSGEFVPFYFTAEESENLRNLFKRHNKKGHNFVTTKRKIERYGKKKAKKISKDIKFFSQIEKRIINEVIKRAEANNDEENRTDNDFKKIIVRTLRKFYEKYKAQIRKNTDKKERR